MIKPQHLLMARLALAFLWLFTAATSLWWEREAGYQVLAMADIRGNFADLCINAGSAVDAIIGFWLLSGWQRRQCYRIQLLVIVVYSFLLSLIAPQFWLHPFGPLTKNIPIIALLLIMYQLDVRDSQLPRQ
jgi:hypothetical protein